MSRTALSRRWVVTATAVAGVVAGHAAAYVVAYPSASLRAEALHTTGHGYWGAAVALSLTAAVAALVTAGWRAAGRHDVGVRFVPLAACQLALFAGAEITERLAAGVAVPELLGAPELGAGLVVQVVVAALAVAALRRWGRLVEAIVAATRRRVVPQTTALRPGRASVMPVRLVAPSNRTRAPPRPAPA